MAREAAMGSITSACRACRSGDANHAAQAWKAESEWICESHLSIAVIRSPVCVCWALDIWTEIIDWDEGDDSQANIKVPMLWNVPINAAHRLDKVQVGALLERIGSLSFLSWISPRGYRNRATCQ